MTPGDANFCLVFYTVCMSRPITTRYMTTQRSSVSLQMPFMQELLLRLVEDHYPLPSNPSQEDPNHSSPAPQPNPPPAGANGVPSRAEGAAAGGRVDKKRKNSSRANVEVSPKSRRTKRSIKAGKGIGEGQQGKAELEDEAYAGGETASLKG